MLKLRDMAVQPDFQLGLLEISPSRRLVEGPAGKVHVEPLIMQVLLLLLDARGSVVTRDELFDQCWGGAAVGDDSLNRAIAGVRRIAAETAPGLFEIETIPRTGYRLMGEILSMGGDAPGEASPQRGIPRRAIVGGVLALAGAAGIGFWAVGDRAEKQRYDELVEKGRQAMRFGTRSESRPFLEQAVAIRPREPAALGLLAYVLAGEVPGNAEETGALVQAAERVIKRALAADPEEPNALLAQFMLEQSLRDWVAAEDQLLRIVTIEPHNVFALGWLVTLYQAAGRNRDSWVVNEKLIALDPVAPGPLFRRALKHWIFGRTNEADRVTDRLIQLWPKHPWVWNARFLIFAFTDRSAAALAMLDGEAARSFVTPERMAQWRPTLAALDHPTPATISAARETNRDAASHSPGQAAYAVIALSGIGEIDAAYEVANGFLFSRGKIVTGRPTDPRDRLVNASTWQNTQWISTPPMADFRADPRFGELCDRIGLTAYWKLRGIKPDYPNVRMP